MYDYIYLSVYYKNKMQFYTFILDSLLPLFRIKLQDVYCEYISRYPFINDGKIVNDKNNFTQVNLNFKLKLNTFNI